MEGQLKQEVIESAAEIKALLPQEMIGTIFDDNVIKKVSVISNMLCDSLLVPETLRGKKADCFFITYRAYRWNLDPIFVAQKAAMIKGKECYEGVVIAAAIEQNLGVRLDYQYTGEGNNRKVKVLGKRKGDLEEKYIEVEYAKVKTATNANWVNNPDQQLSYYGARTWCRRWAPGLLAGVYAADELDPAGMKDVTNSVNKDDKDPVIRRLAAQAEKDPTNTQPKPKKSKKKKDVDDTNVVETKLGELTPLGKIIAKDIGNQVHKAVMEDVQQMNTEKSSVQNDPKNEHSSSNEEEKKEVVPFTLKDYRIITKGRKGTIEYASISEALNGLQSVLLQYKHKKSRKELLEQNRSLLTAAREDGKTDLVTIIQDAVNDGE